MPHVLTINGSPNREGCTFTALSEVAGRLEEAGVGTKFVHIGRKPIQGVRRVSQVRRDRPVHLQG